MPKKEKKKNKLKWLLLLPLIIILVICIINRKPSKFYLDDKYYNEGQYISVKSDEVNNLDGNYILFTYNNFCSLPIHCKDVFKDFMEKYKIDFLSIQFDEYKKTSFYKKVEYAPSVLLIKNGKIVAYLDANKDNDLNKYQNPEEFEKWISEYIYLEKVR